MRATLPPPAALTLRAQTAADLMTTNPVSVGADLTVHEAAAFLADQHFSACPVIDEAGRPVGVLSRSDLLAHERARGPGHAVAAEARLAKNGFQVEDVDRTRVRTVMTPAVYAVTPDTPAADVVAELLARHVHHLFVVDRAGVVAGVISALDVLRRLQEPMPV